MDLSEVVENPFSDLFDADELRCKDPEIREALHEVLEELDLDLKTVFQGGSETRAMRAPQKGKVVVVLSGELAERFKNDEVSKEEFKEKLREKFKKSLN